MPVNRAGSVIDRTTRCLPASYERPRVHNNGSYRDVRKVSINISKSHNGRKASTYEWLQGLVKHVIKANA